MIRSDPLSASISSYRRRLGLFAVLKSSIVGLAVGLFACGVAVLVMKALRIDISAVLLIISASAAVIAFTVSLLTVFPSYNYTAKKLDDLGLKERTSTMLALGGSSAEIAVLQRRDALAQIGTVDRTRLREKISVLSIILCAAAAVFAAVCIMMPASWFDRSAEDSAEQVWQDVLEMLREEQQKLESDGEEALSDEMKDLIRKLENSDNVLNAIGDINSAEENAVEDVLNGGATPRSAREMIDVLEEAKRMLLDLDESESGGEEGGMEIIVPGEEEGEGEEQEGEGENEGEEAEEGGNGRPEDREDGERDEFGQNGRGQEFEGEEEERASNKTEKIYDPISGTVQYGDVFSVYLSEYLKDAENGEIPFELRDAADMYFNILDR
ncbi:MAG: hypothetical protein K6D94_09485 [Clostridiales bacterium]|nr:hypothetical protein [Clostridiales bacterium]